MANRHRTADTPNLTPQGQSVSRKTVAEVPLTGLSFDCAGYESIELGSALKIRRAACVASDAVANAMPKEPFNQAITYLRNNVEALRVHLDDGLVPIDNNDTEQLKKQVALGRKNWMFISSIDAGNRAADLMTPLSSAVRNNLDVLDYVKDVLDKLLGGSRDFEAMRPDVWKLADPEAVRIYRQDEGRHRAEAKSAKRAQRRAGCR